MYRKIIIGQFIQERLWDLQKDVSWFADRLNISDEKATKILISNSMNISMLLRICKILEYDFFRIYSMHLILYATPVMGFKNNAKTTNKNSIPKKSPVFKKNTYTPAMIRFLVDNVVSGKETQKSIIERYNLPKTTVYKWIRKYANEPK